MEEKRQRVLGLVQLAPNVFKRVQRPGEVKLLPRLDPKDFPRALKIERAERLVGRRIRTPDA